MKYYPKNIKLMRMTPIYRSKISKKLNSFGQPADKYENRKFLFNNNIRENSYIGISPKSILSRNIRNARYHLLTNASLDRLVTRNISLDLYHRVITRLLGWHAMQDRIIVEALAPLNAPKLIMKRATLSAPALLADVKQLRGRHAPMAFCSTPLALPTPFHALGALYATQSIALFGPVIAAHLRSRFGSNIPTAYFGGQGRSAAAWHCFSQWINTELKDPSAMAAAIAGANVTYHSLGNWMDKDLALPTPSRAETG